MVPPPSPSKTRWGDDMDDSDDEQATQLQSYSSPGQHVNFVGMIKIPPTHKTRIDSNGIQIVTSYRNNPSNKSQLLKTITKLRIETVPTREAKSVQVRRRFSKFGQAKIDEDMGTKATVQSKDEIMLDDPNADTDLQDEDPSAAIAGNLNAFWAKQQRRQLERKYDVQGDFDNNGGDEAGVKSASSGSGWTQVGSKLAGASNVGSLKYVPPAARVGLPSGTGVGASNSVGYKPDRRDDLNTLRVTNISENTSEADLQELFQRYGRISRVYLAKDKITFQSRGFAFVSFVNKDDAARAMEELDGYGYDHLILKIEFARPNAPRDPATSGTEFRSGYGKALAQETKSKVSYASNLTKGT